MLIELDQIKLTASNSLQPTFSEADKPRIIEQNRLLLEQLSCNQQGMMWYSQPQRAIRDFTIKPTLLSNCVQLMHHALSDLEENNKNTQKHPVFANTEFYVQYAQPQSAPRRLLIVVGESWVYGGNVRDMNTEVYAESELSFAYGLYHTMGACAAQMIDADLYQYAYPGNCNTAMLYWLEQRLPLLTRMQYDEFYVLIQHTDPIRDSGMTLGIENLTGQHSEYSKFVNHCGDRNITWANSNEWIQYYHNWCAQRLNSIVEQYPQVKLQHWGNFGVPTPSIPTQYHTVPFSWTQYNGYLEGYDMPTPPVTNSVLHNNISTADPDLDAQQASVEHGERCHTLWEQVSPRCLNLHTHYPTLPSHALWASRLTANVRHGTLPSAPQIFTEDNP